MNEKETRIPEGTLVNVYWPGNSSGLFGVEFIRGPRGPGDCFVVRHPETGKVSYVGSFELIEQVKK